MLSVAKKKSYVDGGWCGGAKRVTRAICAAKSDNLGKTVAVQRDDSWIGASRRGPAKRLRRATALGPERRREDELSVPSQFAA
jgi:hypothetical protein